MPVPNRVRAIREEQGEGLREAAIAIGLSAGHLSKIERGLFAASDETKRAIARHFDVPASTLFLLDSVDSDTTAGVAS